MTILIKRLRENDWQELRAMRLKALQSDPTVFGSNYQKEAAMTEADWKDWLRTDDGAVFMLYDNTKPIGMTGIAVDRNDPTKKKAVLWGSWLESHARGKGLSEMMYRERIIWAKEHPNYMKKLLSLIVLQTCVQNTQIKSMDFYLRIKKIKFGQMVPMMKTYSMNSGSSTNLSRHRNCIICTWYARGSRLFDFKQIPNPHDNWWSV